MIIEFKTIGSMRKKFIHLIFFFALTCTDPMCI